MIEPEPTPTGCGWTTFVNLVAGLLIYLGGLSPVDATTAPMFPSVQIELAPTEATELAPILDVLERRLTALEIQGGVVRREGQMIVVDIPQSSLPVEEIIMALTQPGRLEFVDLSGLSMGEIGMLTEVTDKPVILTNDAIRDAKAAMDSTGNWVIEITFTEEGSEIIGAFTESHIGQSIGIVLDGRILSAPIINDKVTDVAVISGLFTEEEVRRLAAQINSGVLPVVLQVQDYSIEIK
jgi:preprotein translocase subunit SecD